MLGPILVALGAALWATDTLFRQPLSQQISPLLMVSFEHAIATSVLLVWLVLNRPKKWFMNAKAMSYSFLIGALGSAVATLLFTASFFYLNPTVSILLQKLQPIFVMLFAAGILKERLTARYFFFAGLAWVGAYFLSFPEGLSSSSFSDLSLRGAFLAISAAFLWAASTVLGRLALAKEEPKILLFYRFLFGLIVLLILCTRFDQPQIEFPFVIQDTSALFKLSMMSIISGLLGVGLYYEGLKRVPASVATLFELSFPLCAVAINTFYLGLPLTRGQAIGAVVLLLAWLGIPKGR